MKEKAYPGVEPMIMRHSNAPFNSDVIRNWLLLSVSNDVQKRLKPHFDAGFG